MLNLIPLEQRKELHLKKALSRVRKICFLVLMVMIFLAVLLIGNYYILDKAVAKTQENILLSAINLSGIDNLKQDIITFNSELTKAIQIQNDHVNPLNVLDQLQKLIPAEITLTYLDIDLDKQTIGLQGIAKDRDALLKLQNNLNSSEIFTNFDYPLGSLTEKENIDFLFEGQIDLTKL